MSEHEALLRTLLGIDGSGQPTASARQAVALIRHPHTPWTYGESPEERLGALLVSPLAFNLRGTAWQGLLANELTGSEPTNEPDRNLAERFWSKVKQYRRVATRYEKTAGNFLAFVHVASIMILLQ